MAAAAECLISRGVGALNDGDGVAGQAARVQTTAREPGLESQSTAAMDRNVVEYQ